MGSVPQSRLWIASLIQRPPPPSHGRTQLRNATLGPLQVAASVALLRGSNDQMSGNAAPTTGPGLRRGYAVPSSRSGQARSAWAIADVFGFGTCVRIGDGDAYEPLAGLKRAAPVRAAMAVKQWRL